MIENIVLYKNIFYNLLICLFIIVVVGSFIKTKIYRQILRCIGYIGIFILIVIAYLINFIDSISTIFSMTTIAVGFFTAMYSDVYEIEKYKTSTLHILIDLFAISICATFLSPNVVLFIVFWFLAEIIGFFAIVYEVKTETFRAGLRYLLISMVPADLALMTLLAHLSMRIGFINALSISLTDIPIIANQLSLHISLIIILGFSAKAAILPLHFWLPDAHSLAPAPASSILSGMMVKMGLYGILRIFLITESNIMPIVFMALGSLSSVYGGFLAIIQSDIKRILAYSTIENTGLMMITLMLYKIMGNALSYITFIMLLITHALFKSALFINSGTIEVITHTRNIARLGYLAHVAQGSATSALLSILSLIGIPPTLGFMAKLLLILSIISYTVIDVVQGILLLISISLAFALTIVYSIKYLTIYWGSWARKQANAKSLCKKSLIQWEIALSSLNILLSPFIPIVLGITISIEILVALCLAIIVFCATVLYTYIRMKSIVQDYAWLGGEIP